MSGKPSKQRQLLKMSMFLGSGDSVLSEMVTKQVRQVLCTLFHVNFTKKKMCKLPNTSSGFSVT